MKTEKKNPFNFAAVFVDNRVKSVLISFLFSSVAVIFARSARRGCLLLGSVQLCYHNFGLSLGDICKRVNLFSGKCGSETDISTYLSHHTKYSF